MDQFILKHVLGKLLLVLIMVSLLVGSIIYLNSRWAKIREFRRQADAQSSTKALNFYQAQFGNEPDSLDDDGDGWDKSNDEHRIFLEPLAKVGLLPSLVFDPQNDEEHYYRYQKFEPGDFGCQKPYAVFQVASFETKDKNSGSGSCPDIDWVHYAPLGFTWFGED